MNEKNKLVRITYFKINRKNIYSFSPIDFYKKYLFISKYYYNDIQN